MSLDRAVEAGSPNLMDGEITLVGRIMPASNHTLLGEIDGQRVVYKPISGEAPLWDFPDGTLAAREYAARLVSEATGWDVVPPTVLRDGPLGPGMVQRWMHAPELSEQPAEQRPSPGADARRAVDIVPAGPVPEGWLPVLDAEDQVGRPVQLVHLDAPALRRMAIFDAVVNNTDRKGGHILPGPEQHWWGVDHGICFHRDDKVRTVLWGWAGSQLDADEAAVLRSFLDDAALEAQLVELLVDDELESMRRRTSLMLSDGTLPLPRDGWPSIPWPPF